VFSVSNDILRSFREVEVPKLLVDHGLAPAFVSAQPDSSRKAKAARVGYAGNLGRRPLNRDIIRLMVSENPDTEFHFWGPAEALASEAEDFKREVKDFVGFLERSSNAILHGKVSSEELAADFQNIDCFVLSYTADPVECDNSNSHKILEYLSTGKVVVSSHVSRYEGRDDLLMMSRQGDDPALPALLRDTLANLDKLNSPSAQQARREFALDNTYEKQVDRIAAFVGPLIAESA
jgi:glycosyltransferase involved in cell wall biosynthesis